MATVEVRPIQNEKKFEPFELVITIENIDELKSLYHRMFLTWSELKKSSNAMGIELPSLDIDDDLAEVVFHKVSDELGKYSVPPRNFKKEEN